MNYVLNSPLDVQIELTTSCNHCCYYCYNFWRHDIKTKDNLLLSTKELVRIFDELKKNNILSVTITGGEPFLYPQRVFKCLELAKEAGIQIGINSNLHLLDEVEIKLLAKFKESSILTSILSHRPEIHETMVNSKGSFNKTVKNIQNCLKRNIRVSVNMVLTKKNFHDIYQTASFVKGIGVNTFCATRVVPPIGSDNFQEHCLSTDQIKASLKTLLEVEKKLDMNVEVLNCYPKCIMSDADIYSKFMNRICIAGQTTLSIGANGDIRPCSHSDMVYGNILTDDLKNIWDRMSEWRDGSLLPDFCREECSLRDICTGGCRVMAQYYGNIKGTDPNMEPCNVDSIRCLSKKIKNTNLLSIKKGFNKTQFKINTKFAFRKESFGGIVYIMGTRNMVSVNTGTCLYLQECFSKGYYLSMKEFLKHSNAKTAKEIVNVKRLFYKLTFKKILVPADLVNDL